MLETIRQRPVFAILLTMMPVAVILVARMATHTELAASNPRAAAIMFLWLAADALALTLMVKAPDFKPGLKALLGAVAVACIIVPFAAASPVRLALFDMPIILTAMALTVAVYIGWSGINAFSAHQRSGSWEAAFAEVLPARLVHFLKAELAMIFLGLFRWNVPVDIPKGSVGFAYHRYLTPMLITFLVLQMIELAVVHLLVSLWSEQVAFVLLTLSIWGVIWIIALTKSFRIFPVLLKPNGIQVRSGSIVDEFTPYADVKRVETSFGNDDVKAQSVLNLAILSAPNVCIRLARPVPISSLFGRKRFISSIGLRLDESQKFQSALQRALR